MFVTFLVVSHIAVFCVLMFSDSVENGDKLVETAINAFGRIGMYSSLYQSRWKSSLVFKGIKPPYYALSYFHKQ